MREALTTLAVMLGAGLLAMVVGTLQGVAVARARRTYPLWIAILIGLASLPLYVQVAAWEAAFGKLGWVTLTQTGSASSGALFGIGAVIWIHGISGALWVALFVAIAHRQISPTLLDQARLDAPPRWQLFSIVVPLLMPSIAAGGLVTALLAATEMVVVDMYRVQTIAESLYLGYAIDPGRPWEVFLRTVPSVAAAALIVALVAIPMQRRWSHRTLESRPPMARPSAIEQPLPWRAVRWCLIGLIGGVPIGSLVVKAGWLTNLDGGDRWHRWSPSRGAQTILEATEKFAPEFGWTALLAAGNVLVTLLVAVPLAIACANRPRVRWIVILASIGLVLLPGPIVGMSLIALFTQPQPQWLAVLYDQSLIPSILALQPRTLPLATIALIVGLATVPTAWRNAAALEGQRPWRVSLGHLCSTRRSVLAIAVALAIHAAIADVSATSEVLPPRVTTIGKRVFQLIHAAVRYDEAGLCLWVAAACFLAALCYTFGTTYTDIARRKHP
jgi:iron(III) transport system permease protein